MKLEKFRCASACMFSSDSAVVHTYLHYTVITVTICLVILGFRLSLLFLTLLYFTFYKIYLVKENLISGFSEYV